MGCCETQRNNTCRKNSNNFQLWGGCFAKMINIVVSVILLLVVIGLTPGFIIYGLKNGASGIKIMLYGIGIILLGGIIAVDSDSYLGGFEYLIVLVGLLISLLGLKQKD